MLNIIWTTFFILSFLVATIRFIFFGEFYIWQEITENLFSSAKIAFEISLNLTGILCLWLGLLKIAEVAGLTHLTAKFLMPLFKKLMPEVPEDSKAFGAIVMNMSMNMLGLDNAATPFGLKAMQELQDANTNKDTASNAQILFMVINSSAITIIPITILMYRIELGSQNPSAVFIPILFATSVSTLSGLLAVAWLQKINIFNRVVMSYLAGFIAFISIAAFYFLSLPSDKRFIFASAISNFILFFFAICFICFGLIKKINVYETFISGAKEGFDIAVRIIPYLVAMLAAISVLRSSGVLDILTDLLSQFFELININTDFIPALPTAFMKPLSGSGARAMMIETMKTYGPDSFPGFVSSVIQGSTETTFYILAVYFGSVKITKTRSALPCALFADFMGITAAIIFAYMFY